MVTVWPVTVTMAPGWSKRPRVFATDSATAVSLLESTSGEVWVTDRVTLDDRNTLLVE